MAENEITQSELSEKLGINISTLNRKLKDESFTIGEVERLVDILNISPDDAISIFMPESRKNATI